MSIVCPKCNAENKDGLKFCTSCGHKLEKAAGEDTKPAGEEINRVTPAAGQTPVPPAPAAGKSKNKKKIWIAVVLIALLMVAAVTTVIVVVVATGDNGNVVEEKPGGHEEGKLEDEESEESDTTKPKQPAIVDLDGKIRGITASSTLQTDYRDTQYVEYSPYNLIDNDRASCWAEGVPGYGIGQWVQFDFMENVIIKEVRAIPGYDKVSRLDRWIQNGKLQQVTLTFSNGASETITFEKKRDEQTIPLITPVETTSVTMTIQNAYPGEGPEPAEDTSVSEFHFRGYTAAAYNRYKQELKSD